jgi:thioredoxin-related protein
MKIFVGFFLLFSLLFGEEIELLDSFQEATQKAKKENKKAIIMLTSEGCDACWYMENIVFENENIQDQVNADFVMAKVDITSDLYPEWMSFIGTPTFYFVDGNGKNVAKKLGGAANIRDFGKVLEDVKKGKR